MNIQKNKVVTVTYDLRLKDHNSDIIESATIENPLVFIHGIGAMLPKFEQNLENMKAEDTFQFQLTADEAYGQILQENFMDLPKGIFEENGKLNEKLLFVGNVIELQDKSGHVYQALVHAINDETVTMNFNHPLAGQDLFFTGKVVEVREATEEELAHGHIHHHDHEHDENCNGCCNH